MSDIERSEAEQRAYDEGYRDCAISARAMHDRDMTWRDEENVRLHTQLKGAVEALRWYAEACDPDKQRSGFGDVRQKIAADGGRRARAALGAQ